MLNTKWEFLQVVFSPRVHVIVIPIRHTRTVVLVFPDCLGFLFSWPSTGMWFREQQRGRLLCCRSLVVVSAIAFLELII